MLCWIVVGFGCVTTLLLVIILVLGVAIIYLITRGKRYQYTPPNVVLRTQSESSAADKNQIQEQPPPSSSLPPIPPQNQGKIKQTHLNQLLILEHQGQIQDFRKERA